MNEFTHEEDIDLYLFHEGTHCEAYQFMGAHFIPGGAVFRTWAPHAAGVSVIGDFNGWDPYASPCSRISDGVWECTVPDVKQFDNYKYFIVTKDGRELFKADPFAFHAETRPHTASKLYDLGGFPWSDGAWRQQARKTDWRREPVNIYEVHLGSWSTYEDGNFLSYRALSDTLVPYVKELGYTHVSFLPLMEYPEDASLGFAASGFFAPTSRYGEPKDFMHLVDSFHREGIGVLLSWPGASFDDCAHGLAGFDGSPCYEYGEQAAAGMPSGTLRFDYGRNEVMSFLISAMNFWLDAYHIDGLRLEGLSSMLYWEKQSPLCGKPGVRSHHRNLEGVALLQRMNEDRVKRHPGSIMIAGRSLGWENVSRPTRTGGLGFTFKWNNDWAAEILRYLSLDPMYRKFHPDSITYPALDAFQENYVLPLSREEVMEGRGSYFSQMPGGYEEKLAALRALLAYTAAYMGKKQSFMGLEFAVPAAWDPASQLDWSLLSVGRHRQFRDFVEELNAFYRETPAFWQNDSSEDGFRWISHEESSRSIISFCRMDDEGNEIYVVCNFSPQPAEEYRLGVPFAGIYRELFSSACIRFGGDEPEADRKIVSEAKAAQEEQNSVLVNIPALSVTYFKCEKKYKHGSGLSDALQDESAKER